MLNKTRLIVARQRAQMTKTELAKKVGVEPRAISGFEAGEYLPSSETVERIARVLNYPQEFFVADDMDVPLTEGVSFRSMARMTSKQRDAALAAGALAFLLSDWLESEFELPDVDLPDLREDAPEVAAISLRQYWGLGEKPIKNMVHLLESNGVRVFSLAENSVEVDAYSVWRGHRPCIFLNTMKSAERRRFDAAHELGHLVLHKHAGPAGLEAEKEANTFASAFLMPAASMKSLGRITSLDHLIEHKKRWIVSVAALAYRLHALRLISDWNYHTLCVEISRRGFRKSEPFEALKETSQIWQKVFADERKNGKTLQQLADRLLIPADELVNLVFGLVTIAVKSSDVRRGSNVAAPTLRVVK